MAEARSIDKNITDLLATLRLQANSKEITTDRVSNQISSIPVVHQNNLEPGRGRSVLLRERFDEICDSSIAELKQLQETDGIVEYHERFELIKTRVDLSEEYLVSVYLDGLRMDTQMNIRMFHPQTIRQCFLIGRLYEKVHPKNQGEETLQTVVNEEVDVKASDASESLVLEMVHEEELKQEGKEVVTGFSTFAMEDVISQHQVSISDMEPNLPIHKELLDVCVDLHSGFGFQDLLDHQDGGLHVVQAKMKETKDEKTDSMPHLSSNRIEACEIEVEMVDELNQKSKDASVDLVAHHLFVQLSLKVCKKRKQMKYYKNWKFKYKQSCDNGVGQVVYSVGRGSYLRVFVRLDKKVSIIQTLRSRFSREGKI